MSPDDLSEAGIRRLRSLLDSRGITSRELAEHSMDRIEAIDRAGPTLRSVVEINPDALAIADTMDRERAEGKSRGPLHGIPILLKDNIETADRMLTTAGSLALAERPAREDAFVARRLREAGAVILGKTNLSEWANFRSTHSSSGWSARGGQTLNPHVLERSPSGSSSGSAVAVAAGLCAASVGTETDGSITSPAASCGIVGIKPTLGLVSRTGIIPIAETQDTAGPFGRTVEDAAILLNAMVGVDAADPRTAASEERIHPDYTQFLDRSGLQGVRIGVTRKTFVGFHPGADKVLESALSALREAGAEIVDPADLPSAEQLDRESGEMTTLLYEFKSGLNAYLAGRGDTARVHSLAELIRFNEEHADEEMPIFGQEILTRAEEKGPLTENEYLEALYRKLRLARDEGIDAALQEHRLDALVSVTHGPPWLIDHVYGDQFPGGSASGPAAIAGYPSISVPAGEVSGLPIGVLFFGGAWTEGTLLRIAGAFESATEARRAPTYRSSATVTALEPAAS